MARVIQTAPTHVEHTYVERTHVTTRDWWQRNWKWLAGSGALAAALAVVGVMFALVSLVSGTMSQSEPFRHAVAAARANPAVVEALGRPIRTGVVVSGRISNSGDSGAASLQIPLHGPRGASHVMVEAQRSGDAWSYQTLQVQMVARQRNIDLLEARFGSAPADQRASIASNGASFRPTTAQ